MATSTKPEAGPEKQNRTGSAFLLAQLGAHATALFAERIVGLDLTPPQAGLLRIVALEPGLSQQVIAGRLGTPASRLVALVDDLEERGVIERRRNPQDRRNYALFLTREGGRLMGQLGRAAAAHEDAICRALDADERTQLGSLLEKIAASEGLETGIHPGFRRLGS